MTPSARRTSREVCAELPRGRIPSRVDRQAAHRAPPKRATTPCTSQACNQHAPAAQPALRGSMASFRSVVWCGGRGGHKQGDAGLRWGHAAKGWAGLHAGLHGARVAAHSPCQPTLLHQFQAEVRRPSMQLPASKKLSAPGGRRKAGVRRRSGGCAALRHTLARLARMQQRCSAVAHWGPTPATPPLLGPPRLRRCRRMRGGRSRAGWPCGRAPRRQRQTARTPQPGSRGKVLEREGSAAVCAGH